MAEMVPPETIERRERAGGGGREGMEGEDAKGVKDGEREWRGGWEMRKSE